MNGIYDFENHHTPKLTVDMLMERQDKKNTRRIIMMSCVATIVMLVACEVLLYKLSTVDEKIYIIAATAFSIYFVLGIVIISLLVKKEREVKLL